ncbi:MAG: PKD-like domain-containing protein, partial [Bacteroidota bacterium]
MRKLLQLSYLRRVMLVLLLGVIFTTAKSQTTLVAGDLAFTGYNSDNTAPAQDTFAFVVARVGGLSNATVISFTDNGWLSGSSALATSEGTLTWTCSGAIAQGTQVKISANGVAYINNVANGSCSTSGAFSLSSTGDQVLAYQGLSTAPTFIAAIHMNVCTVAGDGADSDAANWDGTLVSSNRSAKPTGLTTGTTAIWFTAEVDNARYKCTTLSGTASAIATAANTTTNWDVDDINPYLLPCSGPANTAPVFLNTTPQALSVCQNASATSLISLLHVNDANASQTMTWTQQSAPTNGTLTITSATAASGSTDITPGGTISYTPTNGYNGSDAFTIRVSDGTATADMVINVTVRALPSVTTSTTAATCSGTGPNISLTASVASSFAWTLGTNTGSITGASASNGTTINQTLTNPSNAAAGSIVYAVTPTSTTGSCVGSATNITVTVNPTPTITLSAVTNVNTSSTSFSLPYTATAGSPNQYSITTGTTAMPSFSAVTNATLGGSPVSVTIPASAANTYDFVVTVKNSTTGCISANNNFTVTVVTPPSITATGTLSAFTTCAGVVSAEQSFTASGSNLTANLVITPPTGFEVSTTSGSGFTTSISLTPSSGSVSSTTIYVRLTTAATGSPSGNFAVASTGGTTQNVAASATVSAAIGANTISPTSQAICSGATPTTITGSTPTGATGTYGYLWMSSTTSASTGFSSASGTNNTKDYSPGTTTAATWYKRMVTSGTCKNDTSLLTTSGVYALSFPGSNAYVSLSGPSGTPASFQGSGNKYIGMWVYPTSANGGLFNFGNSGACYGSVRLILSGGSLRLDQGCGVVTSTITVPNNQWTYVFMSFNSSTQYTVGKVLNGAVTKQNILTSTSAVHGAGPFNIGANTINGNYLVGQLDEVSVWTTNPTDAEIVSMSQTGLTGSETGLIGYYNFNAGPVNTTVTDNSGHNLTGTLTNINSTSGWVTSTLTLASTATVKVNAVPSLSTATTATVCSGLSPNISLTASVASSYAWTLGTNTGSITGASASNGATINQALTNPSNTTAGSIVYTVTPTATTGSCVGSATDITVTVNPKPTITLGTVNNVNTTATSFSLPYSATQGSPNQYSITTGTTAMPSFSAVTNATLPASPISVTIPASAANTYDFIATVKNSTTGCISANNNFTLTTAAGTTISSVDRGTPSGSTTNATSVTYNVTFGASVTGVTASNFTLSTTGSVTGASIGTVSGSGTSWTVAVSTGTGDGSITLNFDNSTGMTPAISTTLPFAGQTYTIDKTAPTVTTQNITAQLNSSGTVTITGSQIDNGSTDASGIATVSVSPSSFTCANAGANTVTLTVTDNTGNTNTGSATVTVADTVKPVATSQNITKYLNAAGTVSVTASQVNNGSTDACGIATLSVSPSSFTCANVGANTVTLTVTDNNGNIKTTTATVTVSDTIRPVATAQNITKYLNAAGTVSITAAQVNNGSTDACGIATLSVSPSSFTCANVGANTVTLTVTDNNGNIKTTTATVTIADTISPVATAQNITKYLNAVGTVSITAAQVNNGSSDACGIATLSVSPSSFTCANVGANTVTLTVTDNNGNVKTTTATVTVTDTISPVATAQNITKYLNAAGTVSITAAQVNNGSSDACGIATLSVSPSSFTCANVGANTVTLTVTDNNGNIKTTTATVTVADTISPVATAQNITKYLN